MPSKYDFTLITYSGLPELDADDVLVLKELRQQGQRCQVALWDDTSITWENSGVCVIRSTWDYTWRVPEFLGWVQKASAKTKLLNSAQLIAGNWHKGYLMELAAAGIPVIPTVLMPGQCSPVCRGDAWHRPYSRHNDLAQAMRANDWNECIIKPAVGAGTRGVKRVLPGQESVAAGQLHLDELLKHSDVLIQKFIPSVTTYGERSLVYFNNKFSHALRKVPFRHVDEPAGQTEQAVPPTAAELACAQRVLSTLPESPLYARVDLATAEKGEPMLMELELIEPTLFFALDQKAPARFVEALKKH